jgi:hypothetical protein
VSTGVSKAPAATIVRVKVNQVGMWVDKIEKNEVGIRLRTDFEKLEAAVIF